MHGAGALDLARIPPDQLIGQGRTQNRPQQRIRLGHGGGPGAGSWEPYELTAGTLVVLPEITVSHAVEQPEPRQATAEEASLLGIQKAALVTHIRRTYYSDEGQPVETADIVIPSALCEIVYEIPVSR